jgi:PPP family 3-phenylpropionic acid transporter
VLRPSLVYVTYYVAVGASIPYLPVFYRSIGLSLEAVGLMTALAAGVGMAAAPIWGAAADRGGASRRTIVFAALWAGSAGVFLAFARDPVTIALGVALLAAAGGGIPSLLDGRTVAMLGSDRDRFGRARSWGSISFIVASLACGALLERTEPRALFLLYVPALLLTGLAAAALLRAPAGTYRRMRVTPSQIAALLRQGSLGLFLVGSILLWTTIMAVSTFLSIHLINLSGDSQVVGIAWALGAVIEVPLMWAFPALARRVGAERLLVLGALVWAVRSLGFASTDSVPLLIAVAMLGGVGFALTYIGTVTYVARMAPAALGSSAQGIFVGMAFNTGIILGSTVGGQLAEALTLPGLFAVAAAGSALAAGVIWLAVLGPAAPKREVTLVTGDAPATPTPVAD